MSLQTDLLHPELGFYDEGADLTDPATYAEARGAFGQARALPPLAYRSKAFLELENEKIWTRSWVAIGLSSQIPGTGDLLPFTTGFHGVHVQRLQDGALSARLNFHQHGGCRFVPEQCRTGKQTKCSIASCNYTRDAHAMPALDDGENSPEMYKFVGINPDKLVPVRFETLGEAILVNLDPGADDLDGQTGDGLRSALAPLGEPLSLAAHEWLDFKCNWKLFGAELMGLGGSMRALGESDADAAPFALQATAQADGPLAFAGAGAQGGDLRLFWLFPNLLVVMAPDHVLVVIMQATGMGDTLCRVSLLVPRDGVDRPTEELAANWLARLRRIGADAAAAHQQMAQWGTSSRPETVGSQPGTETNFPRHAVNGYVLRKVLTEHTLHWEAPIMDARMLQRRGSR